MLILLAAWVWASDLKITKLLISGIMSCLVQHKTNLLDIQLLYQVNLYSWHYETEMRLAPKFAWNRFQGERKLAARKEDL